jgi:hypothetical protein
MTPLERRIVHLEQRAVYQGGRVHVAHVRRLVRHHWFPGRVDQETDARVEVEARSCIAAWEKFRAFTGEKPSSALRWIEALVRVIAALTPEEVADLLEQSRASR